MIPTKRTQHKPGLVVLGLLLWAEFALAESYPDARAAVVAAYQADEYPKMLLAARRALDARPGYPAALFNLALAKTLNADHRGSLATLRLLAAKGVDFGAAELDAFAGLHDLPEWSLFVAAVEDLNRPQGRAELALQHSDGNFVPEGIAVDSAGTLYLGSIRTGQLLQFGDKTRSLVDAASGWSIFGMRFHPDGSLWFASSAVPQLENVGAQAGQAGLFRLDTATGKISRAAILPQHEPAQVLGDIIIADANTLYSTDSLTGGVYRYYIDSNEFEVLVPRGRLGSPQGLALDSTGTYLYVADYIGGLYRIALSDGSMERLRVPELITDFGIDGLYRHKDGLIAIQNGFRPHRVVRFGLDDSGTGVVDARVLAANLEGFDEPTLGAVDGDNFLFVANSHWNRFDDDNRLPAGLEGPIVYELSLELDEIQPQAD